MEFQEKMLLRFTDLYTWNLQKPYKDISHNFQITTTYLGRQEYIQQNFHLDKKRSPRSQALNLSFIKTLLNHQSHIAQILEERE